ncbi:hypothetical protein HJC23_007401 [Cyclotella cryptica]|uniref:Rubisco LSMT substrate-binding domain-containing protein n=1 Tax=Cyclotella cryptica TaxID=29204 RepID=A0ABD3QHI6_9STRA
MSPLLSSFRPLSRSHHRVPDRISRSSRNPCRHASSSSSSSSSETAQTKRLQTLADLANTAIQSHGKEIFKTFDAQVAVLTTPTTTSTNDDFQIRHLRLGLRATSPTKSNDIVASYPLYESDGSGLALSPSLATKLVYKDVLPPGYDGWTGDVGLLALLLLHEMARLDVSNAAGNDDSNSGKMDLPRRSPGIQSLMDAWIVSLPTPEEMHALHPLQWDEDDQEILQSSSTKKIYRLLDDIDDDSSWLEEKVWSENRIRFPPTVTLRIDGTDNGEETRPCFTQQGFRYAVSLVRSRSFFLDGSLRLLPYLDYANHDDEGRELVGGGVGTLWGSAKGALLKSCRALTAGEEVRISYGPKGPVEYLLDHGFVPKMCGGSGGTTTTASSSSSSASMITAELTFEIEESDRFRDDKLDILEYETYDAAPMEPVQVFDVRGGVGATGEPDPAMIQFLRLVKLGGKDAFLLESIFRKEVWGFMSAPVSEENERLVVNAVIDACQNALSEMEGHDKPTNENDENNNTSTLSENQQLCAMVRNAERQALERTYIYMKQEAEALDLKEYYQQRRLKSLGLDSEWSPENDDVGWGGNRVPGGADYDW